MPLTWPRHRRIMRRQEYLACYDQGKRHFTRHFVVFVHVNGQQALGRVGLAVTKKCGNAVERNRIKRVLRECVRLHQQELPLADIVIVPKRHIKASDISLHMAQADILPFLRRLSRTLPSKGMTEAPANCPAPATTFCVEKGIV